MLTPQALQLGNQILDLMQASQANGGTGNEQLIQLLLQVLAGQPGMDGAAGGAPPPEARPVGLPPGSVPPLQLASVAANVGVAGPPGESPVQTARTSLSHLAPPNVSLESTGWSDLPGKVSAKLLEDMPLSRADSVPADVPLAIAKDGSLELQGLPTPTQLSPRPVQQEPPAPPPKRRNRGGRGDGKASDAGSTKSGNRGGKRGEGAAAADRAASPAATPPTVLYEEDLENKHVHTVVSYPSREGAKLCDFYFKTGYCKFGQACKFDHPPEYAVKLNRDGLPMRQGEAVCEHYAKFKQCKFGQACKYHHPNLRRVVSRSDVSQPATPGA